MSQDDRQPYLLQEISYFPDENYGRQSVEITDLFPDVERSINSVRKLVDYEQLSKKRKVSSLKRD